MARKLALPPEIPITRVLVSTGEADYDKLYGMDQARALLRSLKGYRNRKRLTAAELGKRMGMSEPEVFRIERSTRDVRISTVLRYISAVGLELHLQQKGAGTWE